MAVHARDGLIDPASLSLDWQRHKPIGRLFTDLYCGTGGIFTIKRPSPASLWPGDRTRAR